MSDVFNEDFLDFIQCLNNQNVEYILVGGYSVILHGYSRTTGDLDLWVNREKTNYHKLVKAFHEFDLKHIKIKRKHQYSPLESRAVAFYNIINFNLQKTQIFPF